MYRALYETLVHRDKAVAHDKWSTLHHVPLITEFPKSDRNLSQVAKAVLWLQAWTKTINRSLAATQIDASVTQALYATVTLPARGCAATRNAQQHSDIDEPRGYSQRTRKFF
jgi:hypothetical protein